MPSPMQQALLMAGQACDPFFSSVVLLMGFEGADGAGSGTSGFLDESPAANGFATITGVERISTAQFAVGTSSLLLDGAGRIQYADSANFNLSNRQFTIEMRIRPSTIVTTGGYLIDQWVSPQNGWALYQVNATLNFHGSTTGSNDVTVLTSGNVLTANTWHAVCVDFDGTTNGCTSTAR